MQSNGSPKEILALNIYKDFISEFRDMVKKLDEMYSKYGMGLNDALDILASNSSLENIIKVFKEQPEKLGKLVILMNDLSFLDDDFDGYLTYNRENLQKFHSKLENIINNINTIVSS